MEPLDDWDDYDDNLDQDATCDNWSLNPHSSEEVEKFKDKLNWLTVAIQWPIDNEFYQKYSEYLNRYNHLLMMRIGFGFISLSPDLIQSV